VVLDSGIVEKLFLEIEQQPGYRLKVDLLSQQVTTPENQEYGFEIDAFRKKCLLQGLDEISLTLQYADEIKSFEAQRMFKEPWLFSSK
jgi:3-isopropylmalate/(R)-2-methylmalate dehydratase small subunit